MNKQGYDIKSSTVYQENKSIDRNEIHVVNCPTESMVADYFTKPLQGSKFVQYMDVIMGTKCFDSFNKERVEKTEGK